ncbi:unnamed protein product [Amoebophrya sp. A120]|nr:unnamed protein product [Amoebophrya sp. A120]|eukprot:GSA120T00024682001.1
MNNNPHDDILSSEIPNDDQKRVNMLEELKTRAKGAFQAKDLRNAEMLYSKAIDCVEFSGSEGSTAVSTSGEHLLYSNRAAVRLLLKKNEDAVKDCDKCLKLDPTFIKAHFRKAQGLMRNAKYREAIDACKLGIEQHPGNAELRTLQTEIQTEWDKDLEQKQKFNAEANEIRPDLPKPEPTRIPLTKKAKTADEGVTTTAVESGSSPSAGSTATSASTSKTKAETTASDAGNGATTSSKEEKNDMRGYKKTADGKTTSYFHTEISAEAKALIGDCKPQKIEAAQAVIPEDGSKKVGSAWNQAGTFEERNYTKWFHEKVREAFPKDTEVELPNDLPDIVVNVDSISGDANIACSRGKVKYIHDICTTLKWKFTTADDKSGSGTIKFEADGDGDYDVNVEVDNKSHSSTRQIVNEFVKGSSKGVQGFVLAKLKEVEKKFHAVKI